MSRAHGDPAFTLSVVAGRGDRTRVVAAGELDLAESPRFRETVVEHLGLGPVVVDVRDVTFMDSSGVAAFDALLRACADRGWELYVEPVFQPAVRQILELTGMIDSLPPAPPKGAG